MNASVVESTLEVASSCKCSIAHQTSYSQITFTTWLHWWSPELEEQRELMTLSAHHRVTSRYKSHKKSSSNIRTIYQDEDAGSSQQSACHTQQLPLTR